MYFIEGGAAVGSENKGRDALRSRPVRFLRWPWDHRRQMRPRRSVAVRYVLRHERSV